MKILLIAALVLASANAFADLPSSVMELLDGSQTRTLEGRTEEGEACTITFQNALSDMFLAEVKTASNQSNFQIGLGHELQSGEDIVNNLKLIELLKAENFLESDTRSTMEVVRNGFSDIQSVRILMERKGLVNFKTVADLTCWVN